MTAPAVTFPCHKGELDEHELEFDRYITAVIPAHNEASGIAAAIGSLLEQTRRPDRIIVVADNCTDDTAGIVARIADDAPVLVDVMTTIGNTAKKAGALNQALRHLYREAADGDYTLVMDADSSIDSRWIATAVATLDDNPDAGAVGGVFYGDAGAGLIGQLQRNEYQRYAREIGRRKARAMVLTGTATMYPARVGRHVMRARGEKLPGTEGQVYDTLALTEDNELTLALKTLGYKTLSPQECRVTTEVMATWGDLWRQRMRWQRGAIENLRHYGPTRVTLPYFAQQAMLGVGIFAMSLFFSLTAIGFALGGGLTFRPFWVAIGIVFVAERVVTVALVGWRGTLLAVPLVIEMVYDVFQMAVYLVSLWQVVSRREATWHHAAVPAQN